MPNIIQECAILSQAAYKSGPINHKGCTIGGKPLINQVIIHGLFKYGFTRIYSNHDYIIIVHRGTQKKHDWFISNFPFRRKKLIHFDGSIENKVKVHRGFQSTLDFGDITSNQTSLQAIFKYLEKLKIDDRKIVITGHSMGGALATILATKLRYWISIQNQAVDKSKHIKPIYLVATFGAPAVGGEDFKDFYAELKDCTYRMVNEFDAVPFAPPFFGYRHVGKEFWHGSEATKTKESKQIKQTIESFGWRERFRVFRNTSQFSRLKKDHSMPLYIARAKEVRFEPIKQE